MIPWIVQYWKQLAIAGLAAFLFSFGYYKGHEHEKAKFDAHLAEDARLMAIAEARYRHDILVAQSITDNVTKEYADAVAKINEYYKSHPRYISVCTGSIQTNSVSAASQSASGANAATQGTTEAFAPVTIDLLVANKEIIQCQKLIEFELEQDRANELNNLH